MSSRLRRLIHHFFPSPHPEMLYLSWSLSSIIAPDAELSDITRVVVVVLPKTWKQTKSWSTFPFKDSSERTTAGITVEVAKWCFLWSVIFFLNAAKKQKDFTYLLILVQLSTRVMPPPPWKQRAAYMWASNLVVLGEKMFQWGCWCLSGSGAQLWYRPCDLVDGRM